MEREIYSGLITLNDALKKQINLKDEINKFSESPKPINAGKKQKALTFENTKRILKGKQKVVNGFENKIFPIGKQRICSIIKSEHLLYLENYKKVIKRQKI